MRAVVCDEYGTPDVLRIEQRAVPVPGPGQVLVKVVAAAVNFPDVLLIANKYQISVPLPFTPGSEFSGIVEAVTDSGPQVSWQVGDRVYGSAMSGAFADYVVVGATSLRAAPKSVELDVLAGFWVAYATAYHTLRSVAKVQAGERVVVLGAAGGVGLAAVELASVLGAEVIACASSDDKLGVCRSRGASHTINYETTDFRESMRAIAPNGADVVVDPVGGPLSEQALRSTGWGGRFITVGFASGEIPKIALNLVLLKGVSIQGFEIRGFLMREAEEAARNERELSALLAEGRIQPYISGRFPLDQAAEALREVAERRAIGKVLVVAGTPDAT